MDGRRSTVVLFGAGIQEHAWDPVARVLARTAFDQVVTGDQANGALANLVYNLRFWTLKVAGEAKQGSVRADTQAAFDVYLNSYREIRSQIATELESAETSGELRLWPTFEGVWNALVSSTVHLSIVTTNWDRLLTKVAARQWSDVDENAVFHVHGDRRDPELLLLPTELVAEPYREPEVTQALGLRKKGIMDLMGQTQSLVISGLSLSPMDAELAHILAVGIDHGKVEEVHIADPKHALVCGRLMILLRHRQPAIFGYDPKNPKKKKAYKWRVRREEAG